MLAISILLGISAIIAASLNMVIKSTRRRKAVEARISSPNGIQEEIYIELGGVQQYLQIRGENMRNPVVLFLHGGPGGAMSFLSFYYQRELEKNFTFVQWDQRGCGRSYFKGPVNEIPEKSQLLADLNQLVEYLKERFDCEKVILMGHSYGTLLGCQYIQQHPENVEGYVGLSQCVNVWGTNLRMSRQVIQKPGANAKKVKKLKQSLAYIENASNWSEVNLKDYLTTKMITQQLSPYKDELSGGKLFWKILTSPYLSKPDWAWHRISMSFDKFAEIEEKLMEEFLFDLNLMEEDTKYEVPMLFINGACDTIAPPDIVEEFMNRIEAPSKELYVVEQAGHNQFLEKTGEFTKKVLAWYNDNIK